MNRMRLRNIFLSFVAALFVTLPLSSCGMGSSSAHQTSVASPKISNKPQEIIQTVVPSPSPSPTATPKSKLRLRIEAAVAENRIDWAKYFRKGGDFRKQAIDVLVDQVREGKYGIHNAISVLFSTQSEENLAGYNEDVADAVNSLIQFNRVEALMSLSSCSSLSNSDKDLASEILRGLGDETTMVLIETFNQEQQENTHAALNALGVIGGKRATDFFLGLLERENERQSVVEALGMARYDSKEDRQAATEALVSVYTEAGTDQELRKATITALGHIGTDTAVQALTSWLKNDDWNFRRSVVEALGNTENDLAAPALFTALADGDRGVADAAVRAFEKVKGAKAVDGLLALLKGKNSVTKLNAIKALGMTGSKKAVAPLEAFVFGKEDTACVFAVEALGQIADSGAVKALSAALKRKNNFDIHEKAALALGRIGNKPAVDVLMTMLKSKATRDDAKKALRKARGNYVVSLLVKELKNKDADVRHAAAYALVESANETAVTALVTAMKDKDRGVRICAVYALKTVGNEAAFNALLNALKDTDADICNIAIDALGEIGDSGAVNPLIAMLKSKNESSLRSTIHALQSLNDPLAVPALCEFMINAKPEFALQAANALLYIEDERAVRSFIELSKRNDESLQRAAIDAFVLFLDGSAAPALVELLGSEFLEISNCAATALRKYMSPELFDALILMLDNKQEYSQRHAASLLDSFMLSQAAPRFYKALAAEDLPILAGAYQYFIKLGKPGSEALLCSALDNYGDAEMALAYLNCGNEQLYTAAEAWANKNNYKIFQTIGGGSKSLVWGSQAFS